MSIKIMSAIFESEILGPTERLIMLALADHADDSGRCYPSISRLKQRTGLSERAVQTNIRKLVDQGYVRIIPGGGQANTNVYFVSANPAADAPPQQVHPALDAPQTPQQMRSNPAADAPEPSGTIIKPSESNGARDVLLTVLSPDTADAFIDHRRAKRAKLTVKAAQLIAKDLTHHQNPDAVVEASIKNGWTGVFPEKFGGPHDQSRPHIDRRQQAADAAFANRLAAAARARPASG